jgi:DNA-binding GntR family transcriptional regulator
MTRLLHDRGSTLDEVRAARGMLEPFIAARATHRITPGELADLQGSVDRMRADLGDATVFQRENAAFHAQLARGARNVLLQVITESLGRMTATAGGSGLPIDVRARVADAHQRIVDSVRDHDAHGAAKMAAEHLGEFYHDARRRPP